MTDRKERIAAALGAAVAGVRFAAAPGRVNLIGEHTDYNDGLVLPLAIDRDCLAGFVAGAGGMRRGRSLDLPDVPLEPWLEALAGAGLPATGIDLVLESTIPVGAGLASSGALSVALARAVVAAAGADLDPVPLARAALAAEEEVTGVPCGMMDQLVAAAGRPREPLLIDCRDLSIEPVPLPEDAAVLVVDSGVRRALADGRYAERRAACERAAAALGVASLRDADPAGAAAIPVARHVVSENARVRATAAALRADDLALAGEIMTDGHRSLRDDFDVSTPELDELVGRLLDAGAHGARLTGAGFGGCVVALADRDRAAAVAAAAGVAPVTIC